MKKKHLKFLKQLVETPSPFRMRAKQSVSWQLFSRSERTSVPVSSMPAS